MSRINRVELQAFRYAVEGIGVERDPTSGVEFLTADPDGGASFLRYAVVIEDSDGARGSYVTHFGGNAATYGQSKMSVQLLLGWDPLDRAGIRDVLAHHLRHHDQLAIGPIDLALWDLAARRNGVSVGELIGARRRHLPAYASTYQGQYDGRGLSSSDDYVEFALACRDRGIRALKIHGWTNGDPRREAANVVAVREAVGDDYGLMLDPASTLADFASAVAVGRACDEAGLLWYEDPFRDGSVSIEPHRRLREEIETPLLLGEHVRGIPQTKDFARSGATDLLHIDPEYDHGLTGALELASFAESIGMGVEVHGSGPAARHAMSAIPVARFYELALVGPDMPNVEPPVYDDGYGDQLDSVAADGTVPVPTGPGLGVAYDWEAIRAQRVDHHVVVSGP